MEFAVGIMLVLLGVFTLWRLFTRVDETVISARGSHTHVHSHAHSHGDYIHTHPHGHDPETHPHPPERTPVAWLDRNLGGVRGYRLVRPLLIGMVHGLAGSAAVALLVLAAIGSAGWAVVYLMLFGAGTIVGMMVITLALAVPFAYTDRRFVRLNRGLRFASGVLSLAFGLFIAWQIGVVDGLFSGQPTWRPH
jgi:high-affinity nickel-transport protein